MSQPLIDSARLKFSGLSAEDFEDIPDIGEQRTYTVRAQCTAHTEQAMANEGTRKSVNMKVVRVMAGVTEKIREDEDDGQPSMFDSDGKVPDEDVDESDAAIVDDETTRADPEDDDTPSNVTAFTGPSFSSAD